MSELAPKLPQRVRIVEVGPRDGLQNEPLPVPLVEKLRFVKALIRAGFPAVEVGAFVRPDLVPQMADTAEVIAALSTEERVVSGEVELVALVPNLRGLQRAKESGIRSIAIFTAASEAFNQANTRVSIEESLQRFAAIIEDARSSGIAVRGYLSTCWWCPFSGRVDPEKVERVVARLLELGCDQVSVADTVGAATPLEVRALLTRLVQTHPLERLAVHFHATRGTALANTMVALELGISTIDAAAGGLGGCPFAPGAAGNLATEELIFMLHGMGIETGIDIEAVRQASLRMEALFGRALPSRYLRAGPFVPRDGSA
ncbi:MAG: hydroxymethylglutaryl-CoA lyase [Deltaproteobacteria bacterium]|nr:hydroxymethylglutaryl-CoA lyase [Deltaproteobacteria bacterium]